MRAFPILEDLTPDRLMIGYASALFPMAEDRDDQNLYWIEPEERGLLPLPAFHMPRRLGRSVRQDLYRVTMNTAFDAVIEACAQPGIAPDGARLSYRARTWINDRILSAYKTLHRMGHAHSIECWRDGDLVGGLYGVELCSAFFGESMFSLARDASKIALVHLVARLKAGGFRLLDSQFPNKHLDQFGAVTISQEQFRLLLAVALESKGDMFALSPELSGAQALQAISQTS